MPGRRPPPRAFRATPDRAPGAASPQRSGPSGALESQEPSRSAAALFAVCSRVDPGGTSNAIDIDLGPWADTSTHADHAVENGVDRWNADVAD